MAAPALKKNAMISAGARGEGEMDHLATYAVYVLCSATSGLCAALLLHAWFKVRSRLLLWTAVSFIFLAFNNLGLVLDTELYPAQFRFLRSASGVLAAAVLIYGFVWEIDR
jgi:hypothetical protein